MTATVEHITSEIKSLAPDEAKELFRELQRDFPMVTQGDTDDEAAVEAEWDAEIDARVKDVEDGKVELISIDESERRIDALFAKHGLQRRTA